MAEQVLLFLKYFTSIKNGTNENTLNRSIDTIFFNKQFHEAFIKLRYMKKGDTTFRGFPIEIEKGKDADYWGITAK